MNSEIKNEASREQSWKEEIDKENDKSNLIGKILLVTGAAIAIIGLFGTILYNASWYPSIMYGLLISGFGEVISLLQKIYVNTKKS